MKKLLLKSGKQSFNTLKKSGLKTRSRRVCLSLKAELKVLGLAETHPVTIINFSNRGACLQIDDKLWLGAQVELNCDSFYSRASVVWLTKKDHFFRSNWEIGLKFDYLHARRSFLHSSHL